MGEAPAFQALSEWLHVQVVLNAHGMSPAHYDLSLLEFPEVVFMFEGEYN